MSRQRLRPSLGESTNVVCPRCGGQGTIRDVESMALSLLRIIAEEARKEGTARVIAQLPVDVSTYLLNEKRDWVTTVEQRHDVSIVIVPNPDLETPNHQVRRVREDEVALPENSAVSYKITEHEEAETELPYAARKAAAPVTAPAVQGIIPKAPAPVVAKPVAEAQPAALVRFWRWLFGAPKPKKPARSAAAKKSPRRAASKAGGGRKKASRPAGGRGTSKASSKPRDGSRPAAKRKKTKATASDSPRRDGESEPRGRSRGRRGGRRRRPSGDRARKDNAQSDTGNTGVKEARAGTPANKGPESQAKPAPAARQDRRPAEGQRPAADSGSSAPQSTPQPPQSPVAQSMPTQSGGGEKSKEVRTVWSSAPADPLRGPGRDD